MYPSTELRVRIENLDAEQARRDRRAILVWIALGAAALALTWWLA